MPEIPPPPPAWRRVLRLPRAFGVELRRRVELRVRRWRFALRGGALSRRPELLRHVWGRTDPHAMERVLEELRSSMPSPPPPRPSAGARAEYRGVLTAGWRGDLRIGDVDFDEWLATELGGWVGQGGVRVELSVRVVADADVDGGDAPPAGKRRGEDHRPR